jgi:2-polyprenyl-6-methoxyphenol hydroxylase-like FAD-dependent oxidoreductase
MRSSNETITSIQKNTNRHALVIGGSLAGLFAARVLADYFDTVTVIDRDIFPATPDHRKGVPQSYHAHGLLPTGRSIIEQFFPGIMDDLRADGATVAINRVPLAIVSPKGLLHLPKRAGETVSFSRPLLEWHVRNHVSQRPEVRFITHTEVTGLLATQDHARVTGVRLRERGQEVQPTTLSADLVVDASGRHSQVPQWLVELGYEAPPTETINSDLGYASRFYAKPEQFPAEWQGLIINRCPPHNKRAGLLLTVDHGRWHVTLGGMGGQYPPTDEAGFLQWARALSDPSIYEAIRVARPLTPIRGYRTLQNHLRHFERMQRWPAGLIVIGDAVCAFNPIYGQGMTVSALDARTLNHCLQEQQRAPRADFERHFQQQLSRTVANAWLFATNQDLYWSRVKLSGARPRAGMRLFHRYLDLVLYSAVVDPEISYAYYKVLTLTDPLRALMQPRMAARVLMVSCKRIVKHLLGDKKAPGLALSPEALARLRTMPAAHGASIS